MANTDENEWNEQAKEISDALNKAAKGKPLISVIKGVTVYLASTCIAMDEDCKKDLFAAIIASFSKNYLDFRGLVKTMHKND